MPSSRTLVPRAADGNVMRETDMQRHDLEEGTLLQLDFSKLASAMVQGAMVIPVAVQDAESREVILVAYANEEALQQSLQTRIATFWSTSRKTAFRAHRTVR